MHHTVWIGDRSGPHVSTVLIWHQLDSREVRVSAQNWCRMSFRLHFWMDWQTAWSHNDSPKRCWVHVAIFFMVTLWSLMLHLPLRAQRSHRCNSFPGVHESFSTVFCMVDVEKSKFFSIVHSEIFCLNWFPKSVAQSGQTQVIYTKTEPLVDDRFIPQQEIILSLLKMLT